MTLKCILLYILCRKICLSEMNCWMSIILSWLTSLSQVTMTVHLQRWKWWHQRSGKWHGFHNFWLCFKWWWFDGRQRQWIWGCYLVDGGAVYKQLTHYLSPKMAKWETRNQTLCSLIANLSFPPFLLECLRFFRNKYYIPVFFFTDLE